MLPSLLLLITAYQIRLTLGQASPCPDILSYEPRNNQEPDKWYGVIMLSTEDDLEGIWLKIILDTRAEVLGNWFGETSSQDNTEFHIRNPKYKLEAGPPVSVRFFVKYNMEGHIPSVKRILLNGKTICSILQEPRPTPPMLHTSRPSSPLELDYMRPSIYNNNQDRYDNDKDAEHHNDRTPSDHNRRNPDNERRQVDKDNERRPEDRRPTDQDRRPIDQDRRPIDDDRRPVDQDRRPIDQDRRPMGPETSNTNHRQTSGSSTSRRSPSTNSYTTRPSGSGRHSTSTTAGPDLTNIRDEHGRPIFQSTSEHYDKTVESNSFDSQYSNNRGQPTKRPSPSSSTHHHSNKNQLSIASNTNDDYSEHDFFPGDYVNLIKRPSTRPQTIASRVKPECGTIAARPNALISHGQNTTPGQWPWHAALYHSKGIQLVYTCGGTLISETHIVTAAHCVTKPSTNQKVNEKFLLIYLGKYNLIAFGSEVQDRDVEEIYVHPQYNYSVYFNDIAVLKLSRPVELTNNVRPCCIWEGSTDLDDIANKQGTVVGWGFDENKQLSRNLMQAEMPVVSTVKCIYSNREFFSQFTFENNFCAGFRNGTSVCNGDSGGGMVFPKPGTSGNNAIWQLRGVVSVGVALQTQGICDTSHFIIFTDVAKYLPWIKKIMNTNDT